MKKIALVVAILFMFGLAAAYAETIWPQKKVGTASAAIVSGKGRFGGIVVATNGTNSVTVDVRDATGAGAGDKLIPTTVITSSATDRIRAISVPQVFTTGIYVTITTSGTCEYIVYYETR